MKELNFYVFRHWSAILKEFFKQQSDMNPTC